jgi:formate C-acetyltransferase
MYSNDQHIVDTMVGWGVTLEEARDFVFHGCSQTVANPMRFYRPYHVSAPFSLDLALHNGISTVSGKRIGLATGDPRSFKTFEEVYEAFKKQHEFILKRGMYLIRVFHRALLLRWRAPLTSALHYGCIERGAEYVAGGSGDYPLWYIKDRGLVDVGDSLMAIKKLMSEDKKLTMAELLEALDSNFQGERGEEIHHMCLAAPKYGNDVDEADYMVRDVAKFSASVIRSENNVFGWKYAVNRNGVAWHYAASKGVGALPNGRKVGEPFYDGSLSPMRGMDKDGPSAVLNSALKADYKEAAQSILNQKFSLDMVQSSEALDKVAMLTETFLRSGGSHIQYNFLDKQVLLEAKKHPERYRDLIVRVAGYSAYFVNLTSEVQDDIICRTEQGV